MEAQRPERAFGSLGPALRLLGLVLLFAAAQSARDGWRSLGGIVRGGEAPPLPGPAQLLCGLAVLAVAAFFLRHADENVQALAGGGQPLPPLTLRRLLQPRFEHPLRELWIRSHPGAPAVPMPASRNFGLLWAAGLAVAIPLWLLASVLPVSGRLPSALDAAHHAAIAAACIAALHFASQLARRQDDGWQQAKPPIVPAPLRVVAARTQQLAARSPQPAMKTVPPAGRRTVPPPPPADALREAPMQSGPPPLPTAAPLAVAAFALPAVCPICAAKLASRRCDACGAPALAATFRVLSHLGGGGARRTYLAEAPDRTRVVLKELSIATAPDAAALEAFAREAKMLRELRHPRLPVYLDAFQEEEGPRARLYLAYRYLDGVSLLQEMADRRYTEDEVLDLVEEVLEILRHLHGLQPPLIHRDLKPANLVRRRDGAIALIDFGVARSFDRTLNNGTLVGTVGYMPPEQLAGQADLTCDLYALGATALHLLTRTAPWEFMDGPELRLPRLESARLARRFLERMVAPRRSQRFSSAREAVAALRQLRSGGRRMPRTALAAGAVVAATVLLVALAVDRRAAAPVSQGTAQIAKTTPVRAPARMAPAPASTALVRFRGGVLTSDEMKESLRRLPPWLKSDQPWWIHQHALSLVRLRLLAEEAQRRGLTAAGPDRERQLARAILNAEMARDPDPAPGPALRRAWTRLTSALLAAADVRVEDALLFQLEPGKLTGALPSGAASAETAARLEFAGPSGPCVIEVEPALRRYGGRCEGSGSLAQALLDPDTLMLVDLSPLPRSFYARFTDDFVAARLLEGGAGLEKAAKAERALASADLRVADVSGTISFAQVQSLLAAVQPALRRCLAAGLMDSPERAMRARARIRIELQDRAMRSARIESDPELAVSGCAQALARPELSGSGGFSIAADLSRVPTGP